MGDEVGNQKEGRKEGDKTGKRYRKIWGMEGGIERRKRKRKEEWRCRPRMKGAEEERVPGEKRGAGSAGVRSGQTE